MNIRLAKKSDLEEIQKLIKSAIIEMEKNQIFQWDEIYPSIKDFSEDLKKQTLFIGTEENEIAVVYVLNKEQDDEYFKADWTYKGEDFCVLHRFCVNPKFQNKGIAKSVLAQLIEKLQQNNIKAIRLDVFTENPFALKLYEKAGFHKTGTADWRKGKFILLEKLL